jgi:hypothetical protein
LGLLDCVPGGADDGAVSGQLVHVGLHNEHFGKVVLVDVQGVVSVIVNLLSLGSLDKYSTAIFLDLLVMMNSMVILLDSAGLFLMMMNSSAIFLDSVGLFLMVMMRRFWSVDAVSLLLLYVSLFSLSSHNVRLHGGLVLDNLGGGGGGGAARAALQALCFPLRASQTSPQITPCQTCS